MVGRFVYVQDKGGDEMYDIYALALTGGEPRNLTNTDQTSETEPLFSRDGSMLAFGAKDKSSPSTNIAVMTWPAGAVRLLTHESDRKASWRPVCWSPGRQSSFCRPPSGLGRLRWISDRRAQWRGGEINHA